MESETTEFDEAVRMIERNGNNTEVIQRGHQLIDEANNSLQKSMLICEEPEIELQSVRTHIWYIEPEPLSKSTDIDKEVVKKEINTIITRYEEAANNTNTIIELTNETLNKLYNPSLDIQKKVDLTRIDFEESVTQLCVPLKNKQKGLNEMNVYSSQSAAFSEDKNRVDEEINSFFEVSDDLINTYNNVYHNILEAIRNFCDALCKLPIIVGKLKEEIENSFENFETTMQDFEGTEDMKVYQDAFHKLQNSLFAVLDEVNQTKEKIEENKKGLFEENNTRKEDIRKAEEETNEYKKKLLILSEDIIKEINFIREKYGKPKTNMKSIDLDKIQNITNIKSLDESINAGKDRVNEEQQKIDTGLKNFKSKRPKFNTSLDLLFIMDTTFSMEKYLDQLKDKILLMIQKINEACPQCEIFLGFIGYKDYCDKKKGDEYIDIDFSKNYNKVRNTIKNIKALGGGDVAEDVAGAIKMGVAKSWKSEMRCAVFITDSPCHGEKYHKMKNSDDYPNGDPSGLDIEQLVYDLASKNVFVFAFELTEHTSIMYKKFKLIFEKCKKEKGAKCKFHRWSINKTDKLIEAIITIVLKTYCHREEEILLIETKRDD